MMIRGHRTKFLASHLEALEDRAVPSALGVTAQASSSIAGNARQLAAVINRINAAYSAFADGIRQAEATLVATGGTGLPSGTPTSVASAVAQQVASLQRGITSAVQGRASSSAVALIQSQLTGPSPGSLSSQLSNLLPAALAGSTDGSVPQASLPLLFTVVEGIISSSFNASTADVYIYASGWAAGNAVKNFNAGNYTNQINAAYGSFASNVFQAGSTLIAPAGSTVSLATTQAAVTTINQQVDGLFGALSTLVSGTPAASRARLIQSQFIGDAPGSLRSRMNSALAASALPDGTISQSSLPLLLTAINTAVNGSYTSTVVDTYLLATS